MKKLWAILILFALIGTSIPVFAAPQNGYVLEGGINRNEGFVPFAADFTTETSTKYPYDIVATIYRGTSAVYGMNVWIGGGQADWTPWVSSGSVEPYFDYELGFWIFPTVLPESGKIEVGLRAPAPKEVVYLIVSTCDGDVRENRFVTVSPVEVPLTPTPRPATPVPTPAPTFTPVPTVNPTPSPVPGSQIVLEGGINTPGGFHAFVPASTLVVQTGGRFDLIATAYNRTAATGVVIEIEGGASWDARFTKGAGTIIFTPFTGSGWGTWHFEASFGSSNPVEVVVSGSPPPFQPARWPTEEIRATAVGETTPHRFEVSIRSDRWGIFLPLVRR